MGALTVSINGNAVNVLERSFQQTDSISSVSTLLFKVRDDTGANHYTKGMPVSITDSVFGLQFTGFVSQAIEDRVSPNTMIITDIGVRDNHYLAEKRTYDGPEFTNVAAGVILCQLLNALSQEGITAKYAIRRDLTNTDFNAGTLSNVVATANVGDGDLELSKQGIDVTKTFTTNSDFTTGASLTSVEAGVTNQVANQLNLHAYNVIKFTGTCVFSVGNAFAYWRIYTDGGIAINSNDELDYDVWVSSSSPAIQAAVDIVFTDGTTLRDVSSQAAVDQNGIHAHPGSDLTGFANDQWYSRKIVMPASVVGKTVQFVSLAFEGDATGNYQAYFRNIFLKDSGGTTRRAWYDSTTHPYDPQNAQLNVSFPVSINGYNNISTSIVTAYDQVGTWLSPAVSIDAAKIVKSSSVSWTSLIPTGVTPAQSVSGNSNPLTPAGTTMTIYTSIDNKATWQACNFNQSIPNLLSGFFINAIQIYFKVGFTITGTTPEQSPILADVTATIRSSWIDTKTDSIFTKSTTADWNTGTYTNTITQTYGGLGDGDITLNGMQRDWNDSNLALQTLFGAAAPAHANVKHQCLLTSGTGADVRSRMDQSNGSFLNFTAQVTVTIMADAGGVNSGMGLVYRTTNWNNANNSFGWAAYLTQTGVFLGFGANGGAPAWTAVANAAVTLNAGQAYTLTVVVNGNNHQVYVDGVLYINATNATYNANTSALALRMYNNTGATVTGTFDDFGVYASLSGTWVSADLLPFNGFVGNTVLFWDANPLLAGATILCEVTVNGGTNWFAVSNGAQLPTTNNGHLIVRFTLTAQNAISTPVIHGFTTWLTNPTNSSGNRISPALSLADVGRLGGSLIAWDANLNGGTLSVDIRTSAGTGENSWGITRGLNPGLTYPVTSRLSQQIVDWAVADGHQNFRFQLDIQSMWRDQTDTTGGPGWDFAPLDDAIYKLNQKGFTVTFPIRGMPTWALVNATYQATDEPWFMPDPFYVNIACQVIAARYNGSFNVPGYGPLKIHKLEVLNEEGNIHFTPSIDSATQHVTVVLNQNVNTGTNYSTININSSTIAVPSGVWMQFGQSGGTGDTVKLTSALNIGDTVVNISATGGGTYTAAHNATSGSLLTTVYRGIRTEVYPIYDGHLGVLNAASPTPQPARAPWFLQQVLNTVGPAMASSHPEMRLGAGAIWWMWDDNFTDFIAGLGTALQYVEWVNFHYYSNSNDPHTGSGHIPSITTAITNIYNALVAAGFGTVAIECTEFGWQVPKDVSESTQATYYSNFLNDVIATGKCRRVYLFTYDDAKTGFSQSSLYQWNGTIYHQMAALTTLRTIMAANPQLISGGFGSWTDVTSSNGMAIPGLTTQPLPVLDSFDANSITYDIRAFGSTLILSNNYTQSNYGGGVNASWSWDIANSRVIGTGGTRGILQYNSLSFADGYVLADFDYADGDATNNAGIFMRMTDSSHLYFVKVNDASSSVAPNTIKLFVKNGSGAATQIGTSGTINFIRGTYHRVKMEISGAAFTVSFDGQVVISALDTTLSAAGSVGVLDGNRVQCYQLYIQPYGQNVGALSLQTRLRLATTVPSATPQVLDVTIATFGNSIQAGATIPQTAMYHQYMDKNIDFLAKASNYWWYIDKNKEAFFLSMTGVPAPWIASDGGSPVTGFAQGDFLDNSVTVEDSSDLYRNRQIIDNVLAPVTINENHIGDGASTSWTLANQCAGVPTITVNGQVATVGVKNVDTGKQFYYAVGDNVITADSSSPVYTAATTINFTGPGQYLTFSQADNTTEQAALIAIEGGGTGIVTNVEDGTGLTKAEGDALAQSRLNQYSIRGRLLKAATRRSGLTPGMLLNVFLPDHNIFDDLFLIRQITTTLTTEFGAQQGWYAIEAISGPDVGSWEKLYQRT